MKDRIQTIISSVIPKGCVFDAHSIIEYLLQNYSDVYLSSFQNGTTEYYHSEISKTIASFEESTIIIRVGQCWSQNIHNKFTENVCWRKL